MMMPDRIAVIVGACLAVILQIALAPYIAISFAMPNFIAVYTMVVAVSRPHTFGAVLPFTLGLLYDLTTGGAVGAMALSLTVCSFMAARIFSSLENDTLFMPLVTLALGLLLVEFFYGLLVMLLGSPIGFFEAIAFRIFPCFLYDFAVGVIAYLLAARFLRSGGSPRHDLMQLR